MRWMEAAIVVGVLLVWGCVSTTPQQQFVTGCSTVGEAMIGVITARRAGKIDTATYDTIDDLYDDAVITCSTLPSNDSAYGAAVDRLRAFLTAATGVTGVNYGSY